MEKPKKSMINRQSVVSFGIGFLIAGAGTGIATNLLTASEESVAMHTIEVPDHQPIELEADTYIADLEEELYAEEFISQYDLEELSFNGYDEAINSLTTIAEFNDLSKSLQCRIALREVRKQKCNSKIKYLKQVVRRNKLGGISLGSDGKISLVAPNMASYRNEVNRLNVLVTLLHAQREAYCANRKQCNPYYIAYFCNDEVRPDIKETYEQKCEPLGISEQESSLENVLVSLAGILEKFNDNEVSAEQVKSVMNADLDQLEMSLTGKQDQETKDSTDSVTVADTVASSVGN